MELSGLRTAVKLIGGPIFLEIAVLLLKMHEIAAFVLVDKSGCSYVFEQINGAKKGSKKGYEQAKGHQKRIHALSFIWIATILPYEIGICLYSLFIPGDKVC